jgi:hypothetical protein
MFRASSAHHQESLTVHTAPCFCVCVRPWHCLVRYCILQDSATDGHKHRNRRLYVLLMMSAWRSKHVELYIIWIENKSLSQIASVGLIIRKWVCFEPTVWPDTCCSAHWIRVRSNGQNGCRFNSSHTFLHCIPRQMLVCCVVSVLAPM